MKYHAVISMCARVRTHKNRSHINLNKNEKKKPKISPNNPTSARFYVKICKNNETYQKDAKFYVITEKITEIRKNLHRDSSLIIVEILGVLKKLISCLSMLVMRLCWSPLFLRVCAHVRTSGFTIFVTHY